MAPNTAEKMTARAWLASWIETLQSIDDPLALMTDTMKRGVGGVLEGKALPREAAYRLLEATPRELPALCKAAAIVRDWGKGRIISFSPKVFIPLTRLCRDVCGYCTFRQSPAESERLYMSLEEVLAVARAGAELGCVEALFTLGERPEQRYPEAKAWLHQRGYRTTLEYLRVACEAVLRETSLLPHGNPGTMSRKEMERLQDVNASMGMMLESVSQRLCEPGGPHQFAPSKWPALRMKTLEIAGELRVPFTTGILIGLGETLEERLESLLAIRELHRRHGHLQEVIIQNFRAKSHTPMSRRPDPIVEDLLWTVAAARLILGPDVNLQVPPNLSAKEYPIFLLAGINDWGGISPLTIDYVNPEAPWPQIAVLRQQTEALGFALRPRLPVYPEYIVERDDYLPLSLKERIKSTADGAGYVKGGIERYAGTSG